MKALVNPLNKVFLITCLILGVIDGRVLAQGFLPEHLPVVSWELAGLKDTVPTYDNIIDFIDKGGDPTGSMSNSSLLTQLLEENVGSETVIFFPEGEYLFTEPIIIRDKIVLRGDGNRNTKFIFDLNGRIIDAISILGAISGDVFDVTSDIRFSENNLSLFDPEAMLDSSFWALMQFNDSTIMTSNWAYGSAGSIYEFSTTDAGVYKTSQPFRRSVNLSDRPVVRPFSPVSGVGLECFSMIRRDSTLQQTSNIVFNYAVNCWVVGIESNLCNFAHVDIRRSSHILVRGGYFHEAHAYGGGGQGYGVVVQFGSSFCKVENNIFRKLRHAVLLQAGPQANVISYNYSREAFWTQGGLPEDSAGDMVLHGNYPFLNLFEGNIAQNIVIDASHGMNGPHNYFLRNRAELYGIFMSPGSGTDSTHFIGNEVISLTFLQGFYSLIGLGNFEYGNRVRGSVTPQGTTDEFPASFYLERRPGYWDSEIWPRVGEDDLALSATNPAKTRYELLEFTDCRQNPISATNALSEHATDISRINVYPNPASNELFFVQENFNPRHILLFNASGQLVLSWNNVAERNALNITDIPSGIYRLLFMDEHTQKYEATFVKK